MERKDIQKHQLCLPCSLKLSYAEVWRVTTITHGGPAMQQGHRVTSTGWPAQRDLHRVTCTPGQTQHLPPSPTQLNSSSSPLQQKGFVLLRAFTQSTHTLPLLPISVYDSSYPHLVGSNCSNSILVSMGEGSKWKKQQALTFEKKEGILPISEGM